MVYMFMSFASIHTGKNIGCCIVQVEDPKQANDKCHDLGLMPTECNHVQGFLLPEEDLEAQGMELNKFYAKQEMDAMQFASERVQIRGCECLDESDYL